MENWKYLPSTTSQPPAARPLGDSKSRDINTDFSLAYPSFRCVPRVCCCCGPLTPPLLSLLAQVIMMMKMMMMMIMMMMTLQVVAHLAMLSLSCVMLATPAPLLDTVVTSLDTRDRSAQWQGRGFSTILDFLLDKFIFPI